jgi:hypothetical protein
MGCECQHKQGSSDDALLMMPAQLAAAGTSELSFYIQGVRTGLAIRAAEQQKWQRLGVMAALTFGILSFLKHMK